MSEYYMEFENVESFLEEWGRPDGDNFPVDIYFNKEGKYVILDIAQSRKSRFGRIKIKTESIDSIPLWWHPPEFNK